MEGTSLSLSSPRTSPSLSFSLWYININIFFLFSLPGVWFYNCRVVTHRKLWVTVMLSTLECNKRVHMSWQEVSEPVNCFLITSTGNATRFSPNAAAMSLQAPSATPLIKASVVTLGEVVSQTKYHISMWDTGSEIGWNSKFLEALCMSKLESQSLKSNLLWIVAFFCSAFGSNFLCA